MPVVKYPGLYEMARELSCILNKHPDGFRKVILENVKHLVENLPPEDVLSIFEEDEDV